VEKGTGVRYGARPLMRPVEKKTVSRTSHRTCSNQIPRGEFKLEVIRRMHWQEYRPEQEAAADVNEEDWNVVWSEETALEPGAPAPAGV